jgi:hypothetical protein
MNSPDLSGEAEGKFLKQKILNIYLLYIEGALDINKIQ